MEIRRALQGRDVSFPSAARGEKKGASGPSIARRPATDRLEVSAWVTRVDEERSQAERAFYMSAPGWVEPDWGSRALLDGGDQAGGSELDMMSKELDAQMKCAEIAARIMAGKKVPPQDERYLMESDPSGYKLAMILRRRVPDPDEKECESVLDDEDTQSGGGEGEAAPAAGPSGGGEAAVT